MRLIDLSKTTLDRSFFSMRTGADIFKLLYAVLVAPNRLRFAWAVMLNFGCRGLHLAAFIISIQAIVLAFQFAGSDGMEFRAKNIIGWLHLPADLLPVIVPIIVALVFGAPALLKKVEMAQLDRIVRDLHDYLGARKVRLQTDVFAVLRLPAYLVYATKFCSGLLFVIIALGIVAAFRLDLFFLILGASIIIAIAVTLSSLRQVNEVKALSPLRNTYVQEAREHYRDSTNATTLSSTDRVPLLEGETRKAFLDCSSRNWIKNNRASFNQGIFSGIAIGAIVWFVFGLEDIDPGQLVLLIYLVIAIRYAINTARETGTMVTKLLEARMELADIRLVADLRQGLMAAPSAQEKQE